MVRLMKLLRNITGFTFAVGKTKKSKGSRREKLTSIVEHANTHTPFYKKQYDVFLENANNFTDEEFFYAFSHLPIVKKQHLKEDNTSFRSDILKDKVDLFANGGSPTISEFIKHALISKDFCTTISTGGSSGVPTYRWLDYNDCDIFAQSFLHSFRLNGWSQGDSFVVYYPLKSYFTDTYARNSKQLNRFFGFTMVPFENVTKESVIQLLETLRNNNSTLLVIFPCVLQRVAEIMHREGMEPFESLACINVSGEFFLDCSKKFIQTMFPDSDIQCTYGAVEFGEIAHQKGMSSFDYDVFDDYVYLEQGPSNSILVTAYHQYAFPLIRYRIEDMGKVIDLPDGSQSIKCLEGKNDDYVVGTDGYLYYASFFNNFVNEINRALNYPIIHFMLRHETNEETDEKYMQLNFVISKSSKKEKIKHAALETLTGLFSNYTHIEVNFPEYFEHDYTRKFKIIGEGDGMAEVVGGYYQRKVS